MCEIETETHLEVYGIFNMAWILNLQIVLLSEADKLYTDVQARGIEYGGQYDVCIFVKGAVSEETSQNMSQTSEEMNQPFQISDQYKTSCTLVSILLTGSLPPVISYFLHLCLAT